MPLAALGVDVINQASGGSSTWDWLPGTSLLEKAKVACAGARVVSIMLGTNDSDRKRFKVARPHWELLGDGTLPWEYRENLREIALDLVDSGFVVALNYPPANFDRSHDVDRIAQFDREIDSLVDGVSIFAGDRTSTRYFSENRYLLKADGVHPNELGSCYLSVQWAKAMQPLIKPQAETR